MQETSEVVHMSLSFPPLLKFILSKNGIFIFKMHNSVNTAVTFLRYDVTIYNIK